MTLPDPDKGSCLSCGRSELQRLARQQDLHGVTSDCKVWHRSGPIFVCVHCGHVQKRPDAEWQRDAAEIYTNYDIYHLSGGVEQMVFQGAAPATRSTRLLEHFTKHVALPERGQLLEVGCGNGAMLSSFSLLFPKWVLAGAEQNDRYREAVQRIPGVEQFYTRPLAQIDRTFDLIVLVHVLEHVPDLRSLLDELRRKLTPGGRLLMQVPNLQENPFDLIVADHCSHFVPQTLLGSAVRRSFAVITQATDWIPKEISLVACGSTPSMAPERSEPGTAELLGMAQRSVAWLKEVVSHARELAATRMLSIFGTAIGGSWLGAALGESVDCFVDEDPTRVGKIHLGRPVLSPEAVAPGTSVYVAAPPQLASILQDRLQRRYPSLVFITPPAL